jgi:peptidoglycan LD-endopeptidase CwlK
MGAGKMNKFSTTSQEHLDTCHPDLIRLMNSVLQEKDISILCGYRDREDQNLAYVQGKSKLKYPNSKHNTQPSQAVDIAPYPIDWNNRKRFKDLALVVLAHANQLGIKIRWGGDWDGNAGTKNKFDDLPHYELSNA